MNKSKLLLKSFISALGVFVYVSLVAWLMFNAEKVFGHSPSFIIPVFILLLFIISATITGLLVLGKPIHLYLSGFKKEAFGLIFITLAWLVVFLIGVVIALLLK